MAYSDKNFMSLEQFIKKTRAVRSFERTQVTAQFSHTRVSGTYYRVYVCLTTMEVINPFTKKHEGREYESFFSSISADHAKEQAYNFIIENT